MSCNRLVRILGLALMVLLLPALAMADVVTITADSITATRGVTNPSNAYGTYDGTTAVTGLYTSTGDLVTMTLSNPSFTGTLINVSYGIRMNTSGTWANDNIDIQYTNDGATWLNSQTVQPPAGLTTYGTFNVTSTYTTLTQLNNAQIRLRYTRSAGADNIASGIDGVEMYITYAPPPAVTLTWPDNDTWRTSSSVGFNYTPSSLISFTNCSLFINGTRNATNQTPVASNVNNTISTTLPDGAYLWNVTCTDTSGYNGTASIARTVKIDTLPPNVSLVSPPDDHISSSNLNTFTFNVTDAASIASCSLYVDDTLKDSVSNPAKSTNHNLNATLSIGDHPWYVNCTDGNGWTGQSAVRNISIQITTPTVITNQSEYYQGETAKYSGSNWDSGATLLINTTLPNGTVIQDNESVDGAGTFQMDFPIGYGYPNGTYSITAVQSNDSSKNATTTYVVLKRPVSLTTDAASYMQGEMVTITGLNFSPNTTVNLSILYFGGSNITTVSANSTGGFTHNHQLAADESLSQHNVTAVDLNFSNLNASTNFNVTVRTARVVVNKTSYTANETVGINGTYFSGLATIIFQIYNTVTGRIGRGFPTTLSADSDGSFNTSWYVNNTCSGNYTVLAQAEGDGEANTTFLISNSIASTYTRIPDAVAGSPNTPTLSQVNASDGTLYTMGLSGATPSGYVEFSFRPSMPVNATFSAVNVTIEHRRTTTRPDSFQFSWLNGTSWVALPGAGCSGVPPDTETNQTCDITPIVTNSSIANNLTIRVNYTRSGGGGGDMEIDYGYARYGWTGDPYGCFNFGDVAATPVVTGMTVAPSTVILNAGTTKRVECNFTVTDGDGSSQITGANATFFTSPSTWSSPLSNVSKYQNASCNQTESGMNTKKYSCGVDLLYYAANGTWYCNATGVSSDGSGSSIKSFTVDPLYALSVSQPTLSFGQLAGGALSPDAAEDVINYGNQRINVTALSYGGGFADGNSFNCQTFNITASALRAANRTGVVYSQKIPMDSSFKQLNMTIQSQTGPVMQQNTSYWQVLVPDGPYANEQCNGTLIFQAEIG